MLDALTFDREMLKQINNEQLIASRDGTPSETPEMQTTVISLSNHTRAMTGCEPCAILSCPQGDCVE